MTVLLLFFECMRKPCRISLSFVINFSSSPFMDTIAYYHGSVPRFARSIFSRAFFWS